MKKCGSSESIIIIGPSKSVLVYALHSLEYLLESGVRAKIIIIIIIYWQSINMLFSLKLFVLGIIDYMKAILKLY